MELEAAGDSPPYKPTPVQVNEMYCGIADGFESGWARQDTWLSWWDWNDVHADSERQFYERTRYCRLLSELLAYSLILYSSFPFFCSLHLC